MPTITVSELLRDMPIKTGHVCGSDFERGKQCGADMEYVSITLNNVWGGRSKDGGAVSSYERIGYHGGSVSFIFGLLSTDCPVRVARSSDAGGVEWFQLIDG